MPKPSVKQRFSDRCDSHTSDVVIGSIITAIAETSSELVDVVHDANVMLRSPCSMHLEKLLSHSALGFKTREAVYGCFQLQALFKKRNDLDLGVDTAKAALKSFLRSEVICKQMNMALRDKTDPDYGARAALIFKMQRKISNLLGPLPDADQLSFGFGAGSNVGCSKNTSVRMKLSADATATVGLASYYKGLTFNVQTWPGLERAKVVRGSRFATVPKTSLTDRAINVEPIMNTYFQKGYGRYIRSQLRRVGVDTKDQTLNQRLALLGSRTGALATIDLSMASDTISYLLVMDLLPFDWFEALDACRCAETQLPDGSWIILEKFSSMGNGYTFELETLIFWAVLACVCDDGDIISAYGDDLICPSEHFEKVISALSLLGFIPNPDKSFGTGPFRESCGKDYWGGFEVRPVFIKDAISMKEIFRLHNFFYRTMELPGICDQLLRLVPREFRLFGPDGYGDGHLLSDLGYKIENDKRGWDGRWAVFKAFSAAPRNVTSPVKGDYGAFIYLNTESRPTDGSLPSESMYSERSKDVRYVKRTFRLRIV